MNKEQRKNFRSFWAERGHDRKADVRAAIKAKRARIATMRQIVQGLR